MEEVSAEKLAEEVANGWLRQSGNGTYIPLKTYVRQALQTATQREREEKERLCRQLEFTNTFMKTRIEDSLTLQALIKDNQELVDQVRLER